MGFSSSYWGLKLIRMIGKDVEHLLAKVTEVHKGSSLLAFGVGQNGFDVVGPNPSARYVTDDIPRMAGWL